MSPSRPSDDVPPLAERGLAFLHRARPLGGLTAHQQARIARRLGERPPRRRTPALVRAWALAALVLGACTAAAWASGALERVPGLGSLLGRTRSPGAGAPRPRQGAVPPSEAAPGEGPAGGAPARPFASGDARAPEIDSPPVAAAPPASRAQEAFGAGVPARRRASATAPRAPRGAPHEGALGEPPESAIVAEGRSFARVLDLWRTRRDGPAALKALDAHDRSFSRGQMLMEARVLRAEILLATRREREALAVLDTVPVEQVPRGRELRTLRGELRARFGQCEAARADLAALEAGSDATATRARAALARCP